MKLSRKIPDKPKPRYRCPFYGFSCFCTTFTESGGKQCAFIVTGFKTCQMEKSGSTPDWDKCPKNCPENKQAVLFLKEGKIYPDEFWPPGTKIRTVGIKRWTGMSFQEWWDYVMSEECPRPE